LKSLRQSLSMRLCQAALVRANGFQSSLGEL
jgi:hypothetical protein